MNINNNDVNNFNDNAVVNRFLPGDYANKTNHAVKNLLPVDAVIYNLRQVINPLPQNKNLPPLRFLPIRHLTAALCLAIPILSIITVLVLRILANITLPRVPPSPQNNNNQPANNNAQPQENNVPIHYIYVPPAKNLDQPQIENQVLQQQHQALMSNQQYHLESPFSATVTTATTTTAAVATTVREDVKDIKVKKEKELNLEGTEKAFENLKDEQLYKVANLAILDTYLDKMNEYQMEQGKQTVDGYFQTQMPKIIAANLRLQPPSEISLHLADLLENAIVLNPGENLKEINEKIKNLKVGEQFLVICNIKGHAVMSRVGRSNLGLELSLYNTGLGSSSGLGVQSGDNSIFVKGEHRKKRDENGKVKMCTHYTRIVPDKDGASVTAPIINFYSNLSKHTGKSNADIRIQLMYGMALAIGNEEIPVDEEYRRPQKSVTCTVECLAALEFHLHILNAKRKLDVATKQGSNGPISDARQELQSAIGRYKKANAMKKIIFLREVFRRVNQNGYNEKLSTKFLKNIYTKTKQFYGKHHKNFSAQEKEKINQFFAEVQAKIGQQH